MDSIVKASEDRQTGEWVVRLISTREEIARFDSAFLAKRCVQTINASATSAPSYDRSGR